MSLTIDEKTNREKKSTSIVIESIIQMIILLVLSFIGIFILFIILFIIIRNIQGSPYAVDWSGSLTPSEHEMFRSLNDLWGLDKNPFQQFFIFLWNMISGNWGETSQGISVKEIIMEGYPLSLKLNLLSLGFSLIPGVIFGILAYKFRNKKFGLITQAIKRLNWAIPIFIIGLLLQKFVRILGWYPDIGFGFGWPPVPPVPKLKIQYLIIPAICQSFIFFSFIVDLTYSIIDFYKSPKEMHFLSGKIGFYLSFIFASDLIIERIFDVYRFLGFGWLTVNIINDAGIFLMSAALSCILFTFFIINLSLNFLLHIIRIIIELVKYSKNDTEMIETILSSTETSEEISNPILERDKLKIDNNDETKKSLSKEIFMDLRRKLLNPLTIIGILIILLTLILAIFAKWISPYDYEIVSGIPYDAPSSQHIFGTTWLGIDVYSRCLYGIQTAVKVGLISTIIGMPLGVLMGLISAFFGKWVKFVIDTIIGIMFFLPGVFFAISILSISGNQLGNFYWILGFSSIPIAALFTQQVVSYEMKKGNINTFKIGTLPNGKKILTKLPNLIYSIIGVGCLITGLVIFTFESLSFMGFVDPMTINLGTDIYLARHNVENANWTMLWPAFWSYITILGFIMLGIGLKEE